MITQEQINSYLKETVPEKIASMDEICCILKNNIAIRISDNILEIVTILGFDKRFIKYSEAGATLDMISTKGVKIVVVPERQEILFTLETYCDDYSIFEKYMPNYLKMFLNAVDFFDDYLGMIDNKEKQHSKLMTHILYLTFTS